MKYRGFIIKPMYNIGSDFNIQNGVVTLRKPTNKDIGHYEVLDPANNMKVFCKEFTIEEAKSTVDKTLRLMGMVSNTTKEWDKLDDRRQTGT